MPREEGEKNIVTTDGVSLLNAQCSIVDIGGACGRLQL